MDFYSAAEDILTGSADLIAGSIYAKELNKLKQWLDQNESTRAQILDAIERKDVELVNNLMGTNPLGLTAKKLTQARAEGNENRQKINKAADEANKLINATAAELTQEHLTTGSSMAGAGKALVEAATGSITKRADEAIDKAKQAQQLIQGGKE